MCIKLWLRHSFTIMLLDILIKLVFFIKFALNIGKRKKRTWTNELSWQGINNTPFLTKSNFLHNLFPWSKRMKEIKEKNFNNFDKTLYIDKPMISHIIGGHRSITILSINQERKKKRNKKRKEQFWCSTLHLCLPAQGSPEPKRSLNNNDQSNYVKNSLQCASVDTL